MLYVLSSRVSVTFRTMTDYSDISKLDTQI